MDDAQPVSLTINFDQLRNLSRLGIRRAAAFLSIGLSRTDDFLPASLSLTNHTYIHFLPDPIPEAVARSAVKEFRSWLIGNALRELDLHFNLFLDRIWSTVQLTKLHGQRVSSSHVINNKISNDTNAANKLATVMAELGVPNYDTSCFRSLSNARNCLAHSAGVVRSRDVNSGNNLVIKWICFEPRSTQGEKEIVFAPVFEPFQVPASSEETWLAAKIVEREKAFAIGKSIELSPHELHEICAYYLRISDHALEAFSKFLKARGIS